MFKELNEVKDFLLWAKSEGIVSAKIDGMEFVFNPQTTLSPEAKNIVDQYWKGMNAKEANEMSLDNPLLFDAVKQ